MKRKLQKEVAALVRKWKRNLAKRIRQEMKVKRTSPSKLAVEVKTSRAVIYRLLNEKETGVTLETLAKVARALRLDLKISFSSSGRR